MQDQPRSNTNELILSPGEFAFFQDNTKAEVQTHVGPIVVTPSGQQRPVRFQNGRFQEVGLQAAVEQCVQAKKGEYVILSNPTVDENGLKHPTVRNVNATSPELRNGEEIVVPGPVQFALWPEQVAEVVEGHQLRKDQYLLARVYDSDAAVANWGSAVVVADTEDALTSQSAEDLGLTQGQLLIIKSVNFYIPPTGIEVLQNDDGDYVRDALTLEMAEFCILVNQSGDKRYEKGPQIVFPEPTEEFFEEGGSTKFRPTELTSKAGLYIKINCDYTDAEWPGDVDGDAGPRQFGEGDEVFITGETHPIYYPCEEHSVIRQGSGDPIRYATAVPSGQARYVMNKETGVITTVEGPAMILPNPVTEVFVTRPLSDNESLVMYPGNSDSLDYNRSLRQFQATSGTAGTAISSAALKAEYENFSDYGMEATRSTKFSAKLSAQPALPDQIKRKSTYSKPHSVTLGDNRFEGVPTLRIWTGFAAELVKADGTRRVEVGPKTVMLDYDETVQPMHLSMGKPKTTDKLMTTGYLQVANNKISDIIEVETSDGIVVNVKVSYLVSFEGSKDLWFAVDNYVKFGCDRVRSILKGLVRKYGIREFYANSTDIIRNAVLGENEGDGRPGLTFDENGMIIKDVDVMTVQIADPEISRQLSVQQQEVVTSQIDIDRSKLNFEVTQAKEDMAREILEAQEETRTLKHHLRLLAATDSANFEAKLASESQKRADEKIVLTGKNEEVELLTHNGLLGRKSSDNELQITLMQAQTEQVVTRFKAAEGDLAAAISKLGDDQVVQSVAEAMGPMALIGQTNLGDILKGFVGENGLVDRLSQRSN